MKTRKPMKTLLVFLLVLVMVLQTFTLPVFATDVNQYEDGAAEVAVEVESEDALPDPDEERIDEEPEESALVLSSSLLPEMEIVNVEVLVGGQYQVRWRVGDDHPNYDFNFTRFTVYDGADEALFPTGAEEVPGRFYTTARNANMQDPRLFTLRFTIPAGTVTNPLTFDPLADLSWTYGGRAINTWTSAAAVNAGDPGYMGNPDRIQVYGTPAFVVNADDSITVTAGLRFGSFVAPMSTAMGNRPLCTQWPSSWLLNRPWDINTPYFSIGNPGLALANLVGNHELAVSYDTTALAATEIRLSLNDVFQTWEELDAFAANHPANNPNGLDNHGPHNRFLQIETAGQSSMGREMWTAIISDSAATVDHYLNVTHPLMNNDPREFQRQLAAGSGPNQHRGVLFFSMNHGNELPGPPTTYELIHRLIEEEELVFTRALYYNRMLPFQFAYSTILSGFRYRVGDDYEVLRLCIDRLLERYIIVMCFWGNPDGYANMWRGTYYNFDLNRDALFAVTTETRAIQRLLSRWDPITMMEFHGYFRNFLMDGTTPPYAPFFETDLIEANMIDMIDALGMSIMGRSAMHLYNVPKRDAGSGWDGGTPVFTPSMAMLFGTLGATLEIPDNTQDAFDAQMQGLYGFFYHACNEDTWFSLMYNKAEFKARGVENLDLRDVVDPYMITVHPFMEEIRNEPRVQGWAVPMPVNQVVGRPRLSDGAGGYLSFFPEYYIIPVDKLVQMSPGAAYETLYLLASAGVRLERTTVPVTYDGVTYPVGTFIINMHQAHRSFAQAVLYDGYDASVYVAMHEQIVVSFPHLRAFQTIAVHTSDVFEGRTRVAPISEVAPTTARVDITGVGNVVIVRNDSPDAIRLVNRMLRAGNTVHMINGSVHNAYPGDFVARRADVIAAAQTANNQVFGPMALTVNGFGWGDTFPENSEQIITPNIGYWYWNATWSDTAYYFLVQYEFEHHSRVTNTATARPGTNVYLLAGTSVASGALAADIRSGVPAILGCQQAQMTNIVSNPAINGATRRLTPGEALMRADFAVDNLLTAGLRDQQSVFLMHVDSDQFLTIPPWMDSLVTVHDSDDFFIAGREMGARAGQLSDFRGTSIVASGIYTTSDDIDLHLTALSPNMFERGSMHLYYRILSTALFAKASGILDGDYSLTPELPATIPVAPGPGIPPPSVDPGVEYETHPAYMFGHGGNFRPRADITRAEAATILARTQLLDFEQGVSELPPGMTSFTVFSDVVPGNWFFYYVAWAYDAGLIQGFAGRFRPNDPITREELAAILARTTTLRTGNPSFSDANTISNWATRYVYTVYRAGWMVGDDQGTFRPGANIIRAEVATAMNRILGRIDSRSALNAADVENLHHARPFVDVASGAWYFPSVLAAANDHHLTRDDDGAVDWKYIVR